MKRSRRVLACTAAVFALGAMGVLFSDSVVNSKHNLSVSGPGTIKAATENQVCIFCHAPHDASPMPPCGTAIPPARRIPPTPAPPRWPTPASPRAPPSCA